MISDRAFGTRCSATSLIAAAVRRDHRLRRVAPRRCPCCCPATAAAWRHRGSRPPPPFRAGSGRSAWPAWRGVAWRRPRPAPQRARPGLVPLCHSVPLCARPTLRVPPIGTNDRAVVAQPGVASRGVLGLAGRGTQGDPARLLPPATPAEAGPRNREPVITRGAGPGAGGAGRGGPRALINAPSRKH